MSQNLRDKLQSTLGDAYTLERELGGGGMSRVFVAEDNTLGRKIVVKMLPAEMAAGVSVERFKREIQVVARLQHPHIVPVLSAGQIDGLPFYTMPFVKGESLRARLTRSSDVSVNEAVHLLRDVAAALAYAHSEGVVHRDIKPDNVIVSGGVAVVADFGVSKAVDVAATDGGGAPTGITSLGIALGTPAYMSPEQASADPQVDHRADIYSFGCLAYELISGTSPFGGRSPQQMLAAHVTEAPEPLARRRPNMPPALAALVMKCLEKRAGDRPQSADDLLATLDSIATTPSGGMSPTGARLAAVKNAGGKWVPIAAFAALLLFVAYQYWNRSTSAKSIMIGSTTPIAIGPDLEGMPAISPDGKLVAYTADSRDGARIFVRQIDGGRASLLTGDLAGDHDFPRWSPDGSRVSFVAGGAIYVVPSLTGGSPRRTIEAAGTHSWSPDGKEIVYATRDQRAIKAQSLESGATRTLVEGMFLHSPMLSPDQKVLLYSEGRIPTLNNVSSNILWTLPVGSATPTRISDSTHVNLSPVWMPGGRDVLFVSNTGGTRDVFQVSVTADGRPRGPANRITTSLGSYWISLSADGTRMAYDVVRNFSNVFVVPISTTPSAIMSARQVTRENQHIEAMGLSPDGEWIAYDSDRGGNFDIYKLRLAGGEPVQLTTHPANDFAPKWARDGREIAFHTTRNGTRDIYTVNVDGNAERQVSSGPSQDFAPDFSPDGRSLVYYQENLRGNTVNMASRDGNGGWSTPKSLGEEVEKLLAADSRSASPRFSPDGRFVAIAHNGGITLAPVDGGPLRLLADVKTLGGQALGLAFASASSSTLYASVGSAAYTSIYAIPLAGGTPRLLLRDEPNARFGRWEFVTDGKQLYFTRANWEADVWVMELKR
jgi:serine/threonine-protein kinase